MNDIQVGDQYGIPDKNGKIALTYKVYLSLDDHFEKQSKETQIAVAKLLGWEGE